MVPFKVDTRPASNVVFVHKLCSTHLCKPRPDQPPTLPPSSSFFLPIFQELGLSQSCNLFDPPSMQVPWLDTLLHNHPPLPASKRQDEMSLLDERVVTTNEPSNRSTAKLYGHSSPDFLFHRKDNNQSIVIYNSRHVHWSDPQFGRVRKIRNLGWRSAAVLNRPFRCECLNRSIITEDVVPTGNAIFSLISLSRARGVQVVDLERHVGFVQRSDNVMRVLHNYAKSARNNHAMSS